MQRIFIDTSGIFVGTWDNTPNPDAPIPDVFTDCIEIEAPIPDRIMRWDGVQWQPINQKEQNDAN